MAIIMIWAAAKYPLQTSRDSIFCLPRRILGCLIVDKAYEGGTTFLPLLRLSKIMYEGHV